ncbi:MAG: bifunctional hydroxymethylpyrimidine kinase/phosphomethylpyrimidine kinase [candidate division Zixibacteria bacterium]|nr:bifunctional hydroxymethylpyrimidine kinase/phosphomethylpyrimidine kinase [candidate division Zixibacteria bacterium]
MNRALTIAGSDCSGGAGIQADLKTFTAFGVYGMSAITSVVAENTVGVQKVHDLPVDLVVEQITSCVSDIGTDAVKIGMLSNPAIVEAVAAAIDEHQLPNVVVDPVMVAKSGDPLLSEDARTTITEKLLPKAFVITPNKHEAETLLGRKLWTLEDMKTAAKELADLGCRWVVVKGGHMTGESQAIDVVYDGQFVHTLPAPFIDTPNTHGTGCTFSSAIAASLAKGVHPLEAIGQAKGYITRAIKESVPLGKGHGPTNHLAGVESEWFVVPQDVRKR